LEDSARKGGFSAFAAKELVAVFFAGDDRGGVAGINLF
jgi:hypothetical protein